MLLETVMIVVLMFIIESSSQLLLLLFLFGTIVLFISAVSLGHRLFAFHRWLFGVSSFFYLLASIAIFLLNIGLVYDIFGAIILFHAVNVARGVYGRYRAHYLRNKISTTWWKLNFLIVTVYYLTEAKVINSQSVIIALSVVSFFLLLITIRNLIKYHVRLSNNTDVDWPTLSILVPARNEDHALNEMLINLTSIEYPKLEIIVLDDCSHDKTPEIINSYAHKGVRFVRGKTPAEGWTGKNQALQCLLDEASGEYVLFCDVDVRIGKDSLSPLVTHMMKGKLSMLSVVPARRTFDFMASVFASIQELFMISLPLSTFGQPPASGPCMLFKTEDLVQIGGFSMVSDMVGPEFFFSRTFNRRHKVSMILSSRELGITTRKKLSSIFDTRIRVLYPALQRDPATLLIAVTVLAVTYIGSLTAAISGSFFGAVAVVFLISSNLLVTSVLNPSAWLVSVFSLPIMVLTEMWLAIYSMISYEFGTVRWKKRNICYISLETIPRLPKIKD